MVNANSDMDVRAGERIYTRCTGCHAPDYNRTGPKHCGILGRIAGGVKNFEYTKAMSNSGIIWTNETLDEFLTSPFNMIPGTSMGFVGIASKQERQQLIAYLSQLDEKNSLCK
ncbi:MAG: c-type cytochrome [Pseudomonadota bacterium]